MLLSDICEIIMGQSPSSDSYNVKGQGLPFFQGNADFGKLYPSVRLWCNCPIKKAEAGDLLVSVRAPIGAVNLANQKCCIGRGLAALRPYRDKCDAMYLYYLIKAGKNKLNWLGTGSTFKAITRSSLLSFNVPDYCIALQRKISGKLWSVDKLIHQRNEQLKLFDLLIQSRFLEMFGNMIHASSGFREMTLEEVCRKNGDVRCGPFGTQLSKSDYLDSGVPVWGIPEINSGFQIRASDYISKEKANLLSLYSIISGDIVMSRKGNVGKCEIYPSGYPVGIMHSDVLRIRVNKDLVNPTFLKYQFHFSERIKHQIDIVSHGAIMAGINVTKLKNINVLLPAINRQNQFSEFIHQVDKSKYRGTISLHLLEDVSHML